MKPLTGIRLERFSTYGDRLVVALGDALVREVWWDGPNCVSRPMPAPAAGSDGAILRGNVEAEPDDRTAQLVYADWCDENGAPALAAALRAGRWVGSRLSWESLFPALVCLTGGRDPAPKGRVAILSPKHLKELSPPERGRAYHVHTQLQGSVMRKRVRRASIRLPEFKPDALPPAFDITPYLDAQAAKKGGAA
jgi:uncharacterized protein (TIGR02996 family)